MSATWTVEIFQAALPDGSTIPGERYQGYLPVSEILSSDIVRGACETCWRYGRNFACPPHSPVFPEWVEGRRDAQVVYLRLPTESFEGETPFARAKGCSQRTQKLLYSELLALHKTGLKVAGAGPCRACEVCAVERGDGECYTPGHRIFSLESMGVNVVDMVKKVFGFDLDWEGETSSMAGAVGAIFK